jgi:hypothetical protein
VVCPYAEVLGYTLTRCVAVGQESCTRDHSVLPYVALDLRELGTTSRTEPLHPRGGPTVCPIQIELVVNSLGSRLAYRTTAPTAQAAPCQHSGQGNPE